MPRFTQAEINAYEARRRAAIAPGARPEIPPPNEKTLHSQIDSECRRRGWIAFHGDMTRRTGRTMGEPDFIILSDGGRVWFVEAKTARGHLSAAQLSLRLRAEVLGHAIHVVRSIGEFLALIDIPAAPAGRD